MPWRQGEPRWRLVAELDLAAQVGAAQLAAACAETSLCDLFRGATFAFAVRVPPAPMSAVRRAFGLRTVCNVSNRSLRAMGRDVMRPGVSCRAWTEPRAVLRAQAVGIHSMTRPVACRRVAGAGAGAGTNAGRRTMGMGTKALGVFLGLNITAFGGMALYLTTYSPPEHMFDELDGTTPCLAR